MSEHGLEAIDRLILTARTQNKDLADKTRSRGLDGGARSGFDPRGVDGAAFAGASWTANVLINLGHGDPSGGFARSPRLEFSEACRIV